MLIQKRHANSPVYIKHSLVQKSHYKNVKIQLLFAKYHLTMAIIPLPVFCTLHSVDKLNFGRMVEAHFLNINIFPSIIYGNKCLYCNCLLKGEHQHFDIFKHFKFVFVILLSDFCIF